MAGEVAALRRDLLRWIVLCAAGEFLGIGAGAAWYGAAYTLFGEPVALPARLVAWGAMTSAAVPEALILGAAQVMGLRRFWPVSARKWLVATLAVGLLGWGVGGGIPLFLAGPEAAQQAEPSLGQVLVFAGLFGAGAGALFGGFQAAALSGARRRVGWIAANTAGWAAGLPAIYAGASIGADQQDLALRLACWAVGGLIAGVCIGLATGVCIYFDHRPKRSPCTRQWKLTSMIRAR